jgi:hypothetical protein
MEKSAFVFWTFGFRWVWENLSKKWTILVKAIFCLGGDNLYSFLQNYTNIKQRHHFGYGGWFGLVFKKLNQHKTKASFWLGGWFGLIFKKLQKQM